MTNRMSRSTWDRCSRTRASTWSLPTMGTRPSSAIRRQPPDLISLDLVMPRKSGIRVLAELRRNPQVGADSGGDRHRPCSGSGGAARGQRARGCAGRERHHRTVHVPGETGDPAEVPSGDLRHPRHRGRVRPFGCSRPTPMPNCAGRPRTSSTRWMRRLSRKFSVDFGKDRF